MLFVLANARRVSAYGSPILTFRDVGLMTLLCARFVPGARREHVGCGSHYERVLQGGGSGVEWRADTHENIHTRKARVPK